MFNLAVESINGLDNRGTAGERLRPAEPEFTRLVLALRRAQESGNAGIHIEAEKDRTESIVFFRTQNINPDLARELDQVKEDLGLNPDRREFKVAFGGVARNPDEISILTRSVLRILTELSTFVEVPPGHLHEGIAPDLGGAGGDAEPYFQALSGAKKPCDAFAAVCYEGHWLWIDKWDTASKRTMAYLLVLLALADTGAKENLPVVTIPPVENGKRRLPPRSRCGPVIGGRLPTRREPSAQTVGVTPRLFSQERPGRSWLARASAFRSRLRATNSEMCG